MWREEEYCGYDSTYQDALFVPSKQNDIFKLPWVNRVLKREMVRRMRPDLTRSEKLEEKQKIYILEMGGKEERLLHQR